jgi:hypothetical protein
MLLMPDEVWHWRLIAMRTACDGVSLLMDWGGGKDGGMAVRFLCVCLGVTATQPSDRKDLGVGLVE